ncbi:acetyl-CoA carboxylase biotin carboxyl carrier protein [Marinicrinis sediminis]|uniref:Biotin carboxyl carrier protein of acetyl-CoA carboxylase n=1 Tax=Marinicrinis sediminis TaxID=1652465 RepID=A0ABW5RCI6_9BACL
MYKLSEIKELIKLVNQSDIQELEIENDGSRLFIRKPGKEESVVIQPQAAPHAYAPAPPAAHAYQAAPPAQPQQEAPATAAPASSDKSAAADDQHLHKITSPMVGTFYSSPAPTSPPYVKKGDVVNEKTVVCIVEAMKLMNEIEAEVKGEIVDILAENGQLVEYGQPLFLVKKQ